MKHARHIAYFLLAASFATAGVYDGVPSLPGVKVDGPPVPGIPANQKTTATEFNSVVTGISDLRQAIQGLPQSEGGQGNWFGLYQNASPPSVPSNTAILISDGGTVSVLTPGKVAKDLRSQWFNVVDYGAVGDCALFQDGTIDGGTNILVSTSAPFKASDVGKTIVIDQAGVAGSFNNKPLATTISGFTNASTVSLAATATAGVTGAVFTYGSSSSAGVTAAIADIPAKGGYLYFPPGSYCIPLEGTLAAISKSNVTVLGDGSSSVLQFPPNQRLAGSITTGVGFTGSLNNVRVTGLRFEGTLLAFGTEAKQLGVSYFGANGNVATGIEVDHCVFENQGNLPVEVSTAGSTATITNVSTHDSFFNGNRGGIAYSGTQYTQIVNNRFVAGCEADDDIEYSRNSMDALVAGNVHQRGNTCTTAQGRAIALDGASGGQFINVDVRGNTVRCVTRDTSSDPTTHLPAINANLPGAGTTANISIASNKLEACELPIVVLGNGTTLGDVKVVNNQIDGVLNTSGSDAGIVIQSIIAAQVGGNKITGMQSGISGIWVLGGSDAGNSQRVAVFSNEIYGAGQDGILVTGTDGFDLLGNTITSSGRDNIRIEGNTTLGHVAGGSARLAGAYGVNVDAGTGLEVDLQSIFMTGNSVAPFRDNGTRSMLGTPTGTIRPAQITGDQNDYDPADQTSSISGRSARLWILSLDGSPHNLTGIAGGWDGREVELCNTGSSTLVVKFNSGSSSSGNKIQTGTNTDRNLVSGACAQFFYDKNTNLWRWVG